MKSSLALNFGKLDEKLEKRPVTMPCGFSRVPLVFLGIIPDNRINTSLVGLFGMQITKTPFKLSCYDCAHFYFALSDHIHQRYRPIRYTIW